MSVCCDFVVPAIIIAHFSAVFHCIRALCVKTLSQVLSKQPRQVTIKNIQQCMPMTQYVRGVCSNAQSQTRAYLRSESVQSLQAFGMREYVPVGIMLS